MGAVPRHRSGTDEDASRAPEAIRELASWAILVGRRPAWTLLLMLTVTLVVLGSGCSVPSAP